MMLHSEAGSPKRQSPTVAMGSTDDAEGRAISAEFADYGRCSDLTAGKTGVKILDAVGAEETPATFRNTSGPARDPADKLT